MREWVFRGSKSVTKKTLKTGSVTRGSVTRRTGVVFLVITKEKFRQIFRIKIVPKKGVELNFNRLVW